MSQLKSTIVLHSCCAPCACTVIDQLIAENMPPLVYFYNPNIDSISEYTRRKDAVISYTIKRGLTFFDADYSPSEWERLVVGMENEPERGQRCALCFYMRLSKTAEFTYQHGLQIFATTNGFSRWKNLGQVNDAGQKAASLFPGLTFMARNWRKDNAQLKASAIVKQENIYQQEYCGCIYSKQTMIERKQPARLLGFHEKNL